LEEILMNDLIRHIDRLYTTELGAARIKRNLQLETDDVIRWCRAQILAAPSIEKIGKNWYVTTGEYRITVNADSYTVITARRLKM